MAGKIESTQPLRSAYDFCLDCPKGVDILKVKSMSLPELNEARSVCMNCRGKNGIYKLDAIATAIEAQGEVEALKKELEQSKRAITGLLELMHKTSKKEQEAKAKWFKVGRGATYFKRYSESIKNLQAEGKTQKQMAEILGISIGSVNKICKELKNSSMDAK